MTNVMEILLNDLAVFLHKKLTTRGCFTPYSAAHNQIFPLFDPGKQFRISINRRTMR